MDNSYLNTQCDGLSGEYWKYSDVGRFVGLNHLASDSDNVSKLQDLPKEVSELFPTVTGGGRVVFYNGQVVPHLSQSLENMKDLAADSFEGWQDAPLNALEQAAQSRDKGGASFLLNLKGDALKLDLIFLYGNRFDGDTRPERHHMHHRLGVVGPGHLEISEVHIAMNDIEYSVNQFLELDVCSAAQVERLKLVWLGERSFVYDSESVAVEEDSSFEQLTLNRGGRWTRQEQKVNLLKEGARSRISSLNVLAGEAHCDLTTTVRHQKGHTESEQLCKNIVFGKSRMAFTGRVEIPVDSQKSAARQLCQSTIQGDRAQVDIRPQLLVSADDVVAAHGATCGELNEEEILYLRTRGIGQDVARNMILKAFLLGLLDQVSSSRLRRAGNIFLERVVDSNLVSEDFL